MVFDEWCNYFDEQTLNLDGYIIMTDNPKKSDTFSSPGIYFTIDTDCYFI